MLSDLGLFLTYKDAIMNMFIVLYQGRMKTRICILVFLGLRFDSFQIIEPDIAIDAASPKYSFHKKSPFTTNLHL